jgi:serine/threonine-protein kinase
MEERIGKYELRSEIGRGGFGRVYRAYDPTVDRFVALKVLAAGAESDLLTRFKNEAAAAGKLRHKNIVIIHEYGEHKGTPYLVMEFLEGQDLQHAMSNHTPLTLLQKMRIMAEVAAGLECAHQNGVVHRDVKPANIMLLRDGSVKIMDFGIARLLRNDSARLTQKGYLVGSVAYMSPEQLKDGDVDALCDIWAYGVIYYELLTGQPPFQSGDPASTMYKILHEEPRSLRSLEPGCPEALERIVLKALSKHRDLRYQQFEDLLFDTEPILIELQQQEAARLLTEAKKLFAGHQHEPALNVIREVLELDPTNRQARQLREVVQQQLKRVAVRPRVESIMKKAEEKASVREYGQAMDLLDSAHRLDPTDPEIPVLIERVRINREQSERAAKLLQAAHENLERNNLTSAQRLASEALRIDPNNSDARMLLEQVQRGIAQREEEHRRDETIAKARSLLLIQAYDEAIALLRDLRTRHPDHTPLIELLENAEQQKVEQDRKARIAAGLSEAKSLLRESKLAEAVRRLETLSYDFPSEQEVADLLAHVRRELARVQQAEAVDKIARKAWSLARDFQFEESIVLVEAGLKQYPGDVLLTRILDTVLDSKAAHERERAVVDIVKKCDALRSENRLSEALDILDAALRDWSDDQALIDLRLKIIRELETQKTAAIKREFIQSAQNALVSKMFQKAIQACEEALIQFPGDAEIMHLLATAEKGLRDEEIARFVAEQVATARQLEAANNRQAALDLLERTNAGYPDRQELIQEIARLATALQQEEKRRAEEERRRVEEERRRAERARLEEARLEEERRQNEEHARAEQEQRRAAESARAEEERRKREERARAEQERLRAAELAAAEAARPKADEPTRISQVPQPDRAAGTPSKRPLFKHYLAAAAVLLTVLSAWLLIKLRSPQIPVLTHSPESLVFLHEAGASAPARQSIQIAGQPDGAPFRVRATDGWIQADSEGKVPGKLEVGVQPENLSPGIHTGAVEIASTANPDQWKRVPVSLTIKPREIVKADTAVGGSISTPGPAEGTAKPPLPKIPEKVSGGNLPERAAQKTKEISQRNQQPTGRANTTANVPRPPTSPSGSESTRPEPKQAPPSSDPADAQRRTASIAPPPAPERSPALIPKALWGGKQLGRITWTGQLPPNGRLVLGTNGVKEGPGSARGDYLPGVIDISLVEVSPGDLSVTASPTEIVVVNSTRSNVQFIQIRWKVK